PTRGNYRVKEVAMTKGSWLALGLVCGAATLFGSAALQASDDTAGRSVKSDEMKPHVRELQGIKAEGFGEKNKARDGGTKVEPLRAWGQIFKEEEKELLRKEAPASGYIDNEKDWARLWKAWRGNEKLPAVDFKKELIIVGTSEGPNAAGISA